MNTSQDNHDKGPDHEHGKLVTISVDGVEHAIPDGVYKVSELKHRYGIPPDYELDLVEDAEFKPLNDDRSLHIKGGEVFVSHVRQGGSS